MRVVLLDDVPATIALLEGVPLEDAGLLSGAFSLCAIMKDALGLHTTKKFEHTNMP
jgi:hypothetical protein